MSTTSNEARLAAKVDEIRQNFTHEVERIRGRREWTDEHKRERLAARYLEARGAVASLRERQAVADTERIKTLRLNLFGTSEPVATLAARDARDRVRDISDRQALLTIIDEAEGVGDRSLSRAVAERALRERDDVLLNAYLRHHPRQENDVQDLLDLTAPDAADGALGREMAFGLVPPGELAGLADDQLERLADGRPTAAAS